MSPAHWVKNVNGSGQDVHLACLELEETLLTLIFCQTNWPGSMMPCARCGVPLKEVPDP